MAEQPTKENLLILPGAGVKSGTHLVTKVHARQLDNDYSVMQGVMKVGSLLAPHTHQHEDQVVFVLDGELVFEVGGEGGERFVAPAGSYVIKPRGHEHSFWNAGDEDVNYIELSGGPGFQGFVDESTVDGSVKVALKSEERYGLSWAYHRIPKLMIENRLTSISGLETPWARLKEMALPDLIAHVKEKLAAFG